ncbi:MAG TPA: CDP-diacylglycerol--glycerol-3-phosphate 3-phosphatidyltransferase [Steroidobacteraceae bacterium]|nr:CDP-diacylglycerol--glycerol-3-phosphate 3-phosphatidyltransferase [Steroidobacteraceae bacterium]
MSFPIANYLTVARIFMIPLVVILFYAPYPWAAPACGSMFILAAVTDSLDGYLARKLGQTSALGAFLDPVADKLMVAVALVLLVSHEPTELRYIKFNPHLLITLTAAVIVGREITISALREWMAEMGARGKVAVSSLGKLKTIFQMTGLSMMLFRSDVWFIPAFELGVYCLVAAAALTLWSMIVYLRAAWPELMRSGDRRLG